MTMLKNSHVLFHVNLNKDVKTEYDTCYKSVLLAKKTTECDEKDCFRK